MTPLARLLAAVEAGVVALRGGEILEDAIPPHATLPLRMFAYKAYDNRDLNAAIALIKAMLPGWTKGMVENGHHKYWSAHVLKVEKGEIVGDYGAQADTPARALLIAGLKALVATEGA